MPPSKTLHQTGKIILHPLPFHPTACSQVQSPCNSDTIITTNRNNNIIIFWCPAPLPLPSKLTIKVLSNFDYNKALLRIFISFIMSPFSTTPFKGCLYDNKTSLSMTSWAFQNHIFSLLFPSKFFPLFSPQIHNTEETACLPLDTTGSYTSLHLYTVMPFLGIL